MTRRKILPNDGSSEKQYLNLLKEIIKYGTDEQDRTGVGTRKIHGATMRFDLSDGTVPLLTTKFIPWKAIAHELFWFLSGSTNIRYLLENKVTIWSEWPHKKYVEATGDGLSLKQFEKKVVQSDEFAEKWGSIGKGYGHQWRHWEGPDGQVFDQVSECIRLIKTTPSSRRILFHGWNVADLDKMSLPPCHLLYQFFVADGKLSLSMYQRSCDVGLGVPFNIASYAALLHLISAVTWCKPGRLIMDLGDCHIYNNHVDGVKEQLTREPFAPPSLELTLGINLDFNMDDMVLLAYRHHGPINLKMAV